jgi:predicted ATPase
MRLGMRAYRETGTQLGWSNYLSHLATAYAQLGQFEDALNTLSEARTHVEAHGERHREAEIYRCTGELLLPRADPGSVEAEACVQRALAVARRQQAKGLELRAVASLSRLWKRQGERDEAHQLLAEPSLPPFPPED